MHGFTASLALTGSVSRKQFNIMHSLHCNRHALTSCHCALEFYDVTMTSSRNDARLLHDCVFQLYAGWRHVDTPSLIRTVAGVTSRRVASQDVSLLVVVDTFEADYEVAVRSFRLFC